jgi:nucleoid DNA-binding protein
MRKRTYLILVVLLTTLGLLTALTASAQSERSNEDKLSQRVARVAKVKEDDVNRVLQALGPAMRDELKRGGTVDLPGLGTFRVVRIAEHRDLRNGKVVTIPATNRVEFVGAEGLEGAANSPDATPAETVPAFQFITLPGQTPSQQTPRTRVPTTRTR